MDLNSIIGLIQEQDLQALTSKLGGDESQVKSGLGLALPAILEALNKNTNTIEGAESLNKALEKDHDGSILDNVSGFLNNPEAENGLGILGHLFGDKTPNVAQAVSKTSGLDQNNSMQLLMTLAPLVLGILGKQKKQNNLDANGLNGLTSMLSSNLSQSNPDVMSLITGLLDSNKDGNFLDEALGMLGGLFGKK
jgi:hypothetical protein